MSFFDEADEPRTEPAPQRRRRTTGGGRRPPSRRPPSGRPPGDQQAIRLRRAIAVAALVVVDHPDRDRRPQLPGQRPQQRAARLQQQRRLADPASPTRPASSSSACSPAAAAPGDAVNLQNQIDEARRERRQPARPSARASSVPGEVKTAQQNLRAGAADARGRDHQRRPADPAGAAAPRPARTRSTRSPAEMARFYASDVLYKDYTLPVIVGALQRWRSRVGGQTASRSTRGQFLPEPPVADADVRRQPAARVVAHHVDPAPPSSRRPARPLARTRSASAAPRCRPARPTRSRPARRRRSR